MEHMTDLSKVSDEQLSADITIGPFAIVNLCNLWEGDGHGFPVNVIGDCSCGMIKVRPLTIEGL